MPEYYHERCGKTYQTFRPIKDRICPKCKKPFERWSIVTCKCPRNHQYYTDGIFEVGDESNCPFTGAKTIVTDVTFLENIIRLFRHITPKKILFVSGSGFFGYAIIQLWFWIWDAIQSFLAILPSLLSSIWFGIITVAKLLALLASMGAGGAVATATVFVIITKALAQPFNQFDKKYRRFNKNELDKLPKRESASTKYVFDFSQEIVYRQHTLIMFLLLGIVWGALQCYLSIKSWEAAKQLFSQIAQIGTVAALMFAAFYYALEFRLNLDKKFTDRTNLPKGILVIALFGLASAITVAILSRLESSIPTSSEIAVSLAIDVTAAILMVLYGKVIQKWLENLKLPDLFSHS